MLCQRCKDHLQPSLLPNPLTLSVKMGAPTEHGFTKLKYIVLDDLMDLVDVDI
jgi:hypothetical protein